MGSSGENLLTTSAGVVNGDVVGYSKLIADNEIETHQTLQAFRAIIETIVSGEAGEVVVFVGDEFLAILPDGVAALTASIAIQRIVGTENGRLPTARQVRFRLGVNAGAVSVEDERWFGDAINVAARLQALAKPGGICASAAAIEGADDVPGRVRALGKRRLKNIPEPVLVYEIIDDELSSEEAKPWRRRIVAPDRPSLAISPFVNLGDSEDEHFANGLMMSVAIKLTTIPGLDLTAEASSLSYQGRAHSAQQLGHELGVKFVLEGAVQRAGSGVRVLTQLIDTEDAKIVWADRFDADLDNVFAAQDEVVAKIVEALDIEVIGGELARSYRAELDGADVEIVYRGLHEASKGTPDSLQRAAVHFEEVIERNPEQPLGYALCSWVCFWAALEGMVDDQDGYYRRAADLAQAAIDRDDSTGIGNMVLSHILVTRRDWEGALEAASKATAQRPTCDLTLGVAASVMRYLGRWEEAIDLASRAVRLNPLMGGWYRSILASALFVGEDYEIAAETAEDVVADNESNTEALLTLAAAQAALGRERHAAAAVKHARQTSPGLSSEVLREELPYRDEATLERLVERLRDAGLD